MNRFDQQLAKHNLILQRGPLHTLQLNIGRKCNQACRHCHVDAAPWRTEMLSKKIAIKISDWITRHQPAVVDITGGAPEMNPNFSLLVESSKAAGCHVIDRNNLTIIEEPGFDWLPEFLRHNKVEIIASLPCYEPKNVARQRGSGVFEKSINALRKLNSVGYGKTLPLNIVYNPVGPSLPPQQEALEAEYRETLFRDHGIHFTHLYALTNQPIARFAEDLRKQGKLQEYMDLLASHFNPAATENLMCRQTLSVDHLGQLYDCDFNQMLNLKIANGKPLLLWDSIPENLNGRKIQTGAHCLACTAGSGSSCGGETT
ncbi:MAG: radical SAM protein [Verrucomicrobiales bacterium]|nr:radical SAM protein [Verrucomicrobiales bacterium]|tara:strand:+ start:1405 stop:2349 length:945 start_codon:yes stop_codon:yes gene_type:complete